MALSAFEDKAKEPTAAALKKVLGRSAPHWDSLVTLLASQYAPLDQAWNFSGAKWGWSLRLKQKKRTVLYLTPSEGFFFAGIVLGDKAVEAARASGLSNSVLAIIRSSKRYAEGTGVRLEIRTTRDRDSVLKLAAAKMEN